MRREVVGGEGGDGEEIRVLKKRVRVLEERGEGRGVEGEGAERERGPWMGKLETLRKELRG